MGADLGCPGARRAKQHEYTVNESTVNISHVYYIFALGPCESIERVPASCAHWSNGVYRADALFRQTEATAVRNLALYAEIFLLACVDANGVYWYTAAQRWLNTVHFRCNLQ